MKAERSTKMFRSPPTKTIESSSKHGADSFQICFTPCVLLASDPSDIVSVCYVTENNLHVQHSINSHTRLLRGDVTSRGLAALHTHIGPWMSRDTWCDSKALDCNRYTYSTEQAILPDITQQNVEPNQITWIIKKQRVSVEDIQLDQDRGQWQATTNRAMNLRVLLKPENALIT